MSDFYQDNSTNHQLNSMINLTIKQENENQQMNTVFFLIQVKEEAISESGSSSESGPGKRSYNKKSKDKVKRWTHDESVLYENFIKMYSDIMKNSASKRNSKIFLLMSKFIVTKTPSQCRSHHQKFYPKIFKQNSDQPDETSYNQKQNNNSIYQQRKKIKKINTKEKTSQQYKSKSRNDLTLPFSGQMKDMNQELMNNIYQLNSLPQPQNEEELLNQMLNIKMMFSLQQSQIDPNQYQSYENPSQNMMMNPMVPETNLRQQQMSLIDQYLPENQDNYMVYDDKKSIEKMLYKLEYMENKLTLYMQNTKNLDFIE